VGSFEKTTVIDGFSSIQAVRRSGKESPEVRTRPSRSKLPASRADHADEGDRPAKAKIGHTALPTRHDIVCYECGYEHTITGRIHNAFCPKCHQELETGDVVVEAETDRTIKTVGAVEVKAGGVLRNASVIASQLVLAGTVENSVVNIGDRLVIHKGAKVDLHQVKYRNLVIAAGAKFTYRKKISCRNVTIDGELRGKLHPSGVARIRAGGLLRGEIHSQHLIVEDGGGLKAKVFVGATKDT
jgi:cytoskeletal protein CcmA (bactofilin family)